MSGIPKDLVGSRYGRLEVLALAGRPWPTLNAQWICRCDCGNFSTHSSGNLRQSRSTSCGCLVREQKNATREDLTGKKFATLTAVEALPKSKWKCLCDCGCEVISLAGHLKERTASGCKKCAKRAPGHQHKCEHYGHHKKKQAGYNTWRSMLQRCYNQKNQYYRHYGGRGIRVCDRWRQFENFIDDMGAPPSGLSLDRIDVDGNYELTNCRWATTTEQANNKTTSVRVEFKGETLTLAEWAKRFGLRDDTIRFRAANGIPLDTPKYKRPQKAPAP